MKLNDNYKNKVAWITGASSGIGEQLVYQINALGAKLIISARNENRLNEIARRFNNGLQKKIIPLDLNESETIPDKCREAFETYGHIDYLFNIAGVGHRDYAMNTAPDIDRKIMQVNYFGTVELSKIVLAGMLKQGEGHIVVTSSLSGKYGVPMLSAYSASKHALHGFFESLRAEIKNENIKITIIIPGFIKTEINQNALTGDGKLYGKSLRVQDEGYPADKCAEKILEAVAKEKDEVFIGGKEGLSLLLQRIFPKTFSAIISNHPVKKLRRIKNAFIFWEKKINTQLNLKSDKDRNESY